MMVMDEKNNFALVPRPPSEIEKAEPGAKRVLSGMVADTLALVKKEPPSKREVHVLVAGNPEFNDVFSLLVSQDDDRIKTHIHFIQRMGELAIAVEERKFDLALVQLHLHPPPEHKFSDKHEILRRADHFLVGNEWIKWVGLEVASFLHSVHGIPVIVVSDTGEEASERLLAKQAGAIALFPWFHMDIPAFSECVRGILKNAHQSAKTRPLRIVVLDDEGGPRRSCVTMLKDIWRHGVEILEFEDARDAWEELSRTDPDFFITDIQHVGISCKEMLTRLAERKVKFPILVISAVLGVYETEGKPDWVHDVRRDWKPDLNVSFLSKPWTIEGFRRAFEAALKITAQYAP